MVHFDFTEIIGQDSSFIVMEDSKSGFEIKWVWVNMLFSFLVN